MSVDTHTGEIVQVASVHKATHRAERIRAGMVSLVRFKEDVTAAYHERDWQALGYDDWFAYLDGEYGEHRIQLPREQRREISSAMRETGMSTRAIGAALGVSKSQVDRDLSTVPNGTVEPATIQSLDGRSRPATRPPLTPAQDAHRRQADEEREAERYRAEALTKRSEALDRAVDFLAEFGQWPERVSELRETYQPLYPSNPVRDARLDLARDGLDAIRKAWS